MLASHMRRVSVIVLAFLVLAMLASYQPARANHSTRVFEATICVNGARFKGASKGDTSVGLTMTGRLFQEDSSTIIAEGNSVIFEDVGTEYDFYVSFPFDTLKVGDSVLYSASETSTPYGLEGGAEIGQVEDCCITPPATLDKSFNPSVLAMPNRKSACLLNP